MDNSGSHLDSWDIHSETHGGNGGAVRWWKIHGISPGKIYGNMLASRDLMLGIME